MPFVLVALMATVSLPKSSLARPREKTGRRAPSSEGEYLITLGGGWPGAEGVLGRRRAVMIGNSPMGDRRECQ